MLTEQFLNSCFSLVLNKNISPNGMEGIVRDIGEIILFYKKKEKGDIPILLKNKVDCLEEICALRQDGRYPDNILDSIVGYSNRFKELESFLENKIIEKISVAVTDDNVKQVKIRKKIMVIFSNYDSIYDFLETIKDGSFSSSDEVTENFELVVKELYSNLMKIKREESIKDSSSLDLASDNYESVLSLIKSKYYEELTSTGYEELDVILGGGLQKGRLYIWGGSVGTGKSSFLTNIIVQGAEYYERLLREGKTKLKEQKQVYLYITLENLIDESLMRIYQSMFERNCEDVINLVISDSKSDIRDNIVKRLSQINTTVIMKYFPKFSITPTDISMIIDDVASVYGKENIKVVIIDYLDLLEVDRVKHKTNDMYRLELSKITSSLKDLAVEHNLPVVTVTQLGREVYSKTFDPKTLNLGLISEAIKKVEHADVVALMVKDNADTSKVYMYIGKNRGGRSNLHMVAKVDTEKFKFVELYEDRNIDKTANMVFDSRDEKTNCKKKKGFDCNINSF